MKIIVLLCAAAFLSGCASQGLGTYTPKPTATAVPVSATKAKALQICSYVPTAKTVLSIAAANPYVMTAEAIADSICLAVTNIPFADGPGDRKPRVGHVVVEGRFVKKKRR